MEVPHNPTDDALQWYIDNGRKGPEYQPGPWFFESLIAKYRDLKERLNRISGAIEIHDDTGFISTRSLIDNILKECRRLD